LKALVGRPQTTPALAARLPWPMKRVYRLLTILEHAGLVTRERVENAKHGVKLVALTEAGKDAVKHGMERAVDAAPAARGTKASS
jgi:DNA-binding PadR family transcriptional regulator